MNRYRELLMDYILSKRNLVMKHSGIELMDDEDWQEMESWSDEAVIQVLELLSDTPSGSCPWCLLPTNSCRKCGFGQRHGQCGTYNTDNKYGKIVAGMGQYTFYRTELTNLVIYTRDKYIDIKTNNKE